MMKVVLIVFLVLLINPISNLGAKEVKLEMKHQRDYFDSNLKRVINEEITKKVQEELKNNKNSGSEQQWIVRVNAWDKELSNIVAYIKRNLPKGNSANEFDKAFEALDKSYDANKKFYHSYLVDMNDKNKVEKILKFRLSMTEDAFDMFHRFIRNNFEKEHDYKNKKVQSKGM
ncbi:MAG: hypothetical protein JXR48_15000 [Candidatus Delongbacteria bacterium]|nr:hypothetical protein [Candidatus Delongbacteria bacterium]MBN2836264.1 hypothetical protein [Candidatus Delongbacteria bacterium]